MGEHKRRAYSTRNDFYSPPHTIGLSFPHQLAFAMSSTATLVRATPTFVVHSHQAPTPQINPTRLNDSLHHSCQWGNMGPDGSGMNRLSLNADDAQVRRWLVEELKSLDCEVKVRFDISTMPRLDLV